MKKTLAELNETSWYRFFKVIYIVLYLPIIAALFIAYNASKEVLPLMLPRTITEALNDPEFYKVSDEDRLTALKEIDAEFGNLDPEEQTRFVQAVGTVSITTNEFFSDETDDAQEGEAAPVEEDPQADPATGPDEQKLMQKPAPQAGAGKLVAKVNNTAYLIAPRKHPLPKKGEEPGTVYAPRVTQSAKNAAIYIGVIGATYILIMEILRRIFYYIFAGSLFPKKTPPVPPDSAKGEGKPDAAQV